MSIIEKAVGRLDRMEADQVVIVEPEAPPPAPLPFLESSSPSVNFAEPAAAPAAPEPAATPAPTPAAPAPQPRKSSKHFDIDLARLHALGMVTPESGRTAISEEFRHIKRPLLEKTMESKSKQRGHSNLIMVTSSMPGEGKTFCAINLAMSIAMEMDHTVLLVDADVARPSVLNSLNLQADKGLMDLLHNDELDVRDVMHTTNVDGLRILPAGKSHKHATELLASQAMSRLLTELANRYPDRIIIFDSPPVLLTSEARVLASQMGQIVLVVEAESTTQHNLKDTLRQIGSHDNISLVYNKARSFPGKRYYGGYY